MSGTSRVNLKEGSGDRWVWGVRRIVTVIWELTLGGTGLRRRHSPRGSFPDPHLCGLVEKKPLSYRGRS